MVGWETYFERLGPQGLRLVIAGLLDEESAIRVAPRPVEGLTPVDRARVLTDAVAEEPELGPRLLDALDAAAGDGDAGERLDEARVREELAALLRQPDVTASRILHRLARPARPPLPAPEIRAAAEVLASGALGDEPGTRPKWLARSASDRAGVRELEQERRELESRVRQLEAQQGRLVERSADLEQELSRRLAELRQLRLAERSWREERRVLEKEAARLEKRIEELNERRAREGTGVLASALRRLTTEQRRAASQLEKLRKQQAAGRDPARRLLALAEAVETLLAERVAEGRAAAAQRDEVLRELGTLRAELAGRRGRRAPDGTPSRVGLFVDVQNMFYGAREKNARLDFEALLAAVSEGRQLVRAVAYLVETREIDQSGFIHVLQVKNYEVKRKPLRIRPDGSMKGNWDLEIALDALSTAEHLDVVVLVTGDGDFVPLVRQLRLRGVSVEVFGFPRSTAPDLREVADRFVPISRRLLRPLAPERRRVENGAPSAEKARAAGETAPAAAPVDAVTK